MGGCKAEVSQYIVFSECGCFRILGSQDAGSLLGSPGRSLPSHHTMAMQRSVIPGVTVVTIAGLITDAGSRGLTPELAKALKGKWGLKPG